MNHLSVEYVVKQYDEGIVGLSSIIGRGVSGHYVDAFGSVFKLALLPRSRKKAKWATSPAQGVPDVLEIDAANSDSALGKMDLSGGYFITGREPIGLRKVVGTLTLSEDSLLSFVLSREEEEMAKARNDYLVINVFAKQPVPNGTWLPIECVCRGNNEVLYGGMELQSKLTERERSCVLEIVTFDSTLFAGTPIEIRRFDRNIGCVTYCVPHGQ